MEINSVFTFSSANLSENLESLGPLLAKAKQGDQAAFAELYNLYFKKIYRFIFFRVSHKEVAEDLAEDVFLKAYLKISSISDDNAFAGWLYQIARNKVIDYYREKKITVDLEEVENTLEYENNVIDFINLSQQQAVFVKHLKQLTPEQQIVIKLKFLEDLSNEEISAVMQKNEGTIRVIQHRAIQRLKELIGNNNE